MKSQVNDLKTIEDNRLITIYINSKHKSKSKNKKVFKILMSRVGVMKNEDLVSFYRCAEKNDKKKILKKLNNNWKLGIIISNLRRDELVELVKIYPDKEYMLDSITHLIASKGVTTYYNGGVLNFEKNIQGNVSSAPDEFFNEFNHKTFSDKFKNFIKRKDNDLTPKVEQLKNLFELKKNERWAYLKNIESLDKQSIDAPTKNSRVETSDSEMSKIFDKYATAGRKKGESFYNNNGETEIAKVVKENIKNEYITMLGKEREDFATLIAHSEFENYAGLHFYLPYDVNCGSEGYSVHSAGWDYRICEKDCRGWKKNFLEIEKIDNFTVNNKNFGTTFVVKSEFSPTTSAVDGKWAPIYEYYIKNQDGKFIRIGMGKYNTNTEKMETTLTTDNENSIYNGEFYSDSVKEKEKTSNSLLRFNSDDYTGTSIKLSRKQIDRIIVKKSIQEYIGEDNIITDITQIANLKSKELDYNTGRVKKISNCYAICYLKNNKETYQIVLIDENGLCKEHSNMEEENSKETPLEFYPGSYIGKDDQSLYEIETKISKKTYLDKDGKKYSIYRDDKGILRLAEEFSINENRNFSEELDSYSLLHENIKKLKEEYDKKKIDNSKKTELEVIKKYKEQLIEVKGELEQSQQDVLDNNKTL